MDDIHTPPETPNPITLERMKSLESQANNYRKALEILTGSPVNGEPWQELVRKSRDEFIKPFETLLAMPTRKIREHVYLKNAFESILMKS